jgi:hypothetical protein
MEAQHSRLASGWTSWDKPIIILGEDVEHEKARTLVGCVIDGTAIVTICNLRGRENVPSLY